MTDDELLAALGAQARRERDEPIDPRWEQLARGELSDAEAAALLAEEQVEADAGAFAPLGEAFEEQLTDRLMALQVAPARPANNPMRRGLWLVPPVALAAAAVLWVGLSGPTATLPAYTAEVMVGGVQEVRGDPVTGQDIVLVDGTPMAVALRPAEPTPAVDGSAWVVTGDAHAPFGGTVETSASGVVRVSGTLGDGWTLAPGEHRLVVVVHPEGVADAWPVAAEALEGRPTTWPSHVYRLVVRSP